MLLKPVLRILKRLFLVSLAMICLYPFSPTLAVERLDLHSVTHLMNELERVAEDLALEYDPDVSARCEPEFSKRFSSDTLDVRVFFGYADDNLEWNPMAGIFGTNSGASTEPFDRFFAAAFRGQMLKPCERFQPPAFSSAHPDKFNIDYFACGFNEDSWDPDLLHKELRTLSDRTILVDLRIKFSSLPYDIMQGSEIWRESQQDQSKRVREDFRKALLDADAVFYVGHARKGGGPDFFPAHRDSSGHIAYGEYQRHRTGISDMVNTLNQRRDRGPALLGVLACDSDKLFYNDLRRVAPQSALLLTSDLATVDDTFRALGGAMNALLSRQCGDAFYQSLNSKRNWDRNRFIVRGYF